MMALQGAVEQAGEQERRVMVERADATEPRGPPLGPLLDAALAAPPTLVIRPGRLS